MGKSFSTGLLTNGLAQDSSNNIGIGGAANASYKLQVTGTTNLIGALSGTSATFSGQVYVNYANPVVRFKGATLDGYIINSADKLYIADYNTATKNIVLDLATGNVGIGTSSPESVTNFNTLQVDGTSGAMLRTGTSAYGGYVATIASADVMVISNVRNPINGTFSNTGKAASVISLYGESGNGYLTFSTSATNNSGPTERMRITSGGYVKATSTGSYNDVNAANHEFVNGTASANSFFVGNTNTSYSGATLLRINGSRTTTNGTYNLIGATNGNSTGEFLVRDSGNCLNTNNSYTGTSDIKLKQDIIDASSQWEDIKQMRIRKFRFKKQVEQDENAPYLLGVIAQELELVSPNLVDETPDFDGTGEEVTSTTKSVKYSIIYMKAVKALQEAMAKIEILEDKVKQLENK